MPWQTPKTDWAATDSPQPSGLNRIEGNTLELKKAATIDIADAGNKFTATNVEGALQELAGNVSTGKGTIASAITDMGQAAQSTETFAQLAAKIRAISSDADAGVADVLTGKTFYQGSAKKTGTMPNRGAITVTPGTSDQTIDQGYHSGAGKVLGDADLVAGNIKTGVAVFTVTGTYTSDATAQAADILAGKTAYVNGPKVSGTMTDNGVQTITPGTTDQALGGYYAAGSKVLGDPDMVPANIVKDKQIFNVTGTAWTEPFVKYRMMKRQASFTSQEVIARMDETGTFCIAGGSGGVRLFKRSGSTWSAVSSLDSATVGNVLAASYAPNDTHILVGSGATTYLLKRSGDTISKVAQVSPSAGNVKGLSRWDSASTYCIVAVDDGYVYLLKRSGDTMSAVSSLSKSLNASRMIGANADLTYMVVKAASSVSGFTRSGDALSDVTVSGIGQALHPALTPDGTYCIGIQPYDYGCRAYLYKRTGNTFSVCSGPYQLQNGNQAYGNIGEYQSPEILASTLAYPVAMTDSPAASNFLSVIGIEGEKLRLIATGPEWFGLTGTLRGLCADYSTDGEYLVYVSGDGSTSKSVEFAKVGELP